MVPGQRGTLGHSKRCPIADDERINELMLDQSDILWEATKELVQAAIGMIFNSDSEEDKARVHEVEQECLQKDNSERVTFVDSKGGQAIDKYFKERCELLDHLEGVAEDNAPGLVKRVIYDSHAGEWLSTALNGGNTQDFCSMVCRKNESGVALKTCLHGCAETFAPNCWSQCRVWTCERGCLNAFPNCWPFKCNVDRRNHCYDRCKSKCSYE